jgi:hypothetical protein
VSVVALPKPKNQQAVVKELEEALEAARAGNVSSFVLVMQNSKGELAHTIMIDNRIGPTGLVYSLEVVKLAILRSQDDA